MRNDLSALEMALALRERGLWPIPLRPPGTTLPSREGHKRATGKEPFGKAWGKTRPSEDDLKARYDTNPGAGVGVLLGPEGGVVDVEVDGPDGERSFLTLMGGELVPTLGWSSRRGPHWLFRYDPRLAGLAPDSGVIKLPSLPGLEIRVGRAGKQLQSACPPTVGEDGVARRWNDCDEIAPLPELAFQFLETALGQPRATSGSEPYWRVPVTGSGPCEAWFGKALQNESGKVAMAKEGDRHIVLLAAANTLGGNLCHGYLSEDQVVNELTVAGQRSGLPEEEVAATIRDGLEHGKASPLPWPDRLERHGLPNPTGSSPASEAPGSRPWPALRLDVLPNSPAFPVEVFPVALQTYCQEAAASLQVPIEYVGAAMLTVAGAAIGQSVNMALGRTWQEPPLLFMVLVGRAGSAKSPTIRAVARPLSRIDRRLRRRWEAERQQWERARRNHAQNPNGSPPGPEPQLKRAIVRDATRESLCPILRENPRGLLCDPDEATKWVRSFNEYKGKGGSDRQFWLSVWSSSVLSVDRKGGRESTFVAHPFVSVLGGIPPSMLGTLSEERGRDDGFLDRCLFVFPEQAAFPRQQWDRTELSERAELAWQSAIELLHGHPMEHDPESDSERPCLVPLGPDAERPWAAWFDGHCQESESPEFPVELDGAWSKMRAHAARFVLILAMLERACDPMSSAVPGHVEARHVRGAIALAEYFKAQAARVRHEMTGGVGSTDARDVLDWFRRNQKVEFREADVSADLRRFRNSPHGLAAALKALTDVGAIRARADDRPPGPGRKGTTVYEVHPSLPQAPENPGNTANGAPPRSEPPNSGNNGISGRPESMLGRAATAGREVFEL